MNTSDTITALNQATGRVGPISRAIFEHPVLNPGTLVEVEPGTKSYLPEMFRSRIKEPATDPVEETPKTKTSKKETD